MAIARTAVLAVALAAIIAVGACSGAIPYGPNSAMVPLDGKIQGCRAYRLEVEGGFSPAAIYFRRPDGSFTTDRRQARCR